MNQTIKKIAINTNYRNSAGAKVCVHDLGKLLEKNGYLVNHNDWEYKKKYDVILFMAPDSEVDKARSKNPKAIIGIMDPKIGSGRDVRIDEIKKADFILVSSIEQREKLLRYNKNIVIYYMFPNIKQVVKKHEAKATTIIGYHGNKRHLHNFYPDINQALDRLAKKYKVEFWAIYNAGKLGEWKNKTPNKITIKHIQWSEKNYCQHLSQCDIGLVPNLIYINNIIRKVAHSRIWKKINKHFAYSGNDYLIRFKYSTNPGRIYIFSQLGIPVISDFAPSANQFIKDGHSGLIVNSSDGWYRAMERLVTRSDLRQRMANNLRVHIEEHYSIEKNFNNLINFLNDLKQKHDKKNAY